MKPERGKIDVYAVKAASYGQESAKAVRRLLEWIDVPISPGDKVLVKPNLLRADVLTCTNAAVIAETCAFLLDKGCKVTIGDSPGFGTAKGVGKAIGLDAALLDRLGKGASDVPIITLDSPVSKPLSLGGRVGLSRYALEADHIMNLPKLKAHAQMRVTASVKNLFGCVSGVRKAFLHARYGDKTQSGAAVFPSAVVDILGHLPRVTSLIDGIEAMHVRGPSGGKPYPAHLLAISESPVALDTALYAILGVAPEEIPVWKELLRREIYGAHPDHIAMCGEDAGQFDLTEFKLPRTLMPETFNPARLVQSMVKRLWARFRI
ncbi:MAG: hypothetical protein DELT_02404 [Desulfovibrio sp.]